MPEARMAHRHPASSLQEGWKSPKFVPVSFAGRLSEI
jgi:hypothetical protein